MRRAALIYNPEAGTRRRRRAAQVEQAAGVLRAAGVEVECMATRAAGSGGEQALAAARAGYDAVIACGGDGTVNELLQGVMAAAAAGITQPALGVIPVGTGNALANDLGIARAPASAARQLLGYAPCRIAVGQAEFATTHSAPSSKRYFLCIAGIGADARMVYDINFGFKRRAGMLAYYFEGVRQWLRGRYPLFEAEWKDSAGALQRAAVSQVLVVRVGYFGGFLKRLAPRATLERDDAHLVLFRTQSMIRYARYTINSFLERPQRIAGVDIVAGREVTCRALATQAPGGDAVRIYAELDGELAGTLPVRITIVPDAVPLLMPAARWPQPPS